MKSSLIQCPDGGGAKGGAIVGLYQNGGCDESLSLRILFCLYSSKITKKIGKLHIWEPRPLEEQILEVLDMQEISTDVAKKIKMSREAELNMERCAEFMARMIQKYGKKILDDIAAESNEQPEQPKRDDKVAKKKCYIYTRVSTAAQIEGYSLEAQQEKLHQYAEYKGLKIVGEYCDAGKSGKSIKGRPSFMKMFDDISSEKDDISYVLVFKLSRFGRNAADILKSLQLLTDYDVDLVCVEDAIDSSTQGGRLTLAILSAMAEIERENINVQFMAGRMQKVLDGGWPGGPVPFGYQKDNQELFINEEADPKKHVPKCPKEKELAIIDALKAFRMLEDTVEYREEAADE